MNCYKAQVEEIIFAELICCCNYKKVRWKIPPDFFVVRSFYSDR